MQPSPLTPLVVNAVLNDLARSARHEGLRAGERRTSRLAGLRGRLAARRGSPLAPSPARRPTARPGRA